MLNFRYVLHLQQEGSVSVVRHATFRVLGAGEIIRVTGHGDWRIRLLVAADDQSITDAIAYCDPVEPRETRPSG